MAHLHAQPSEVVRQRVLPIATALVEDRHRDGPDALGRLRGGPQDTRLAGDRCAFPRLVLDAAVGTGGQFDSGNPVIGLRMRRCARGGEAGKKREQGKDATKHCSGQIGRVAMRVHPA